MNAAGQQLKRIFSFSSILTLCGTLLVINNRDTIGIVLISLGIIGSIIDYSLEVQKEVRDREDRERLYDNIKQTIGTIPFIGTEKSTDNSTFH